MCGGGIFHRRRCFLHEGSENDACDFHGGCARAHSIVVLCWREAARSTCEQRQRISGHKPRDVCNLARSQGSGKATHIRRRETLHSTESRGSSSQRCHSAERRCKHASFAKRRVK